MSLQTARESIKNQIKNAYEPIQKSKKSASNPKLQANYKELCYRMMLLNEAEVVQERALQQVQKGDSQAYFTCVSFFKNATNTDGPGAHTKSFAESIRDQNKAIPAKEKALALAFQNMAPITLQDETIYRNKITDLIEKICDYILYHRIKYTSSAA